MTRQSVGFGVVVGLVIAWESVAIAQSPDDLSIVEFDPGYAVRPTSIVEGPGVKIGEGTVLHPVFGLETGVVSNVFYEEAQTNASGVLRLLAQVGAASLSTARLSPASTSETEDDEGTVTEPGDFQYRADLRLSYDLMLSGNDTVTETGGLGVGALFKGMVRPQGPWSFGFEDNFHRLIRAANFETDANVDRDINMLRLLVLWHPSDRSLSGYLYYHNTIDVFERSTQKFADRWEHRVGLHPMWRWLPHTMIFGDFSQGVVTGFGADADMKVTSYPLKLTVGLSTLLSLKTTFNIQAGYTRGFYDSGPSFSAPVASAHFGYRYSPLGRITVGYDYTHVDSINANFYRDHIIKLRLSQGLAPMVLMVQPELHFRKYEGVTIVMGPPTRNDVILAVVGGLHYSFRKWLAATIDYRFTTVQSNFTYMIDGYTDTPDFVRHDLLAGLRVAM